jgi:hypothetical protein
MARVSHALFVASAATFLLALGCGRAKVDPKVLAEHRSRLELAEEPDGAQTVLEVRQVMYGVDPAEAAAHEDHDHDGDGVQDHAPEDHVDHEHADGDHADHNHAADAGDDVEEPAEDEVHAVVEESADEHAEGDRAEGAHAHEDHDHDGDGVQDHTPEEHDTATAAKDPFAGKKPVVDEMDVVMVGSVGGVPNPSDQSHPEFPFAKGQAVFFLADPEAVAEIEEHSHKHAPGEECAFCAAHAAESAHLLAVVQFADEKGKTLPIDVRELFELKEKETVVVEGKAKIDGGMLTVNATGLYVRR